MAPKPRPGLEKWWKAWFPVNGMIQRQLSPFEIKVVSSLARNIQAKTTERVRRWFWVFSLVVVVSRNSWSFNPVIVPGVASSLRATCSRRCRARWAFTASSSGWTPRTTRCAFGLFVFLLALCLWWCVCVAYSLLACGAVPSPPLGLKSTFEVLLSFHTILVTGCILARRWLGGLARDSHQVEAAADDDGRDQQTARQHNDVQGRAPGCVQPAPVGQRRPRCLFVITGLGRRVGRCEYATMPTPNSRATGTTCVQAEG